MWQHTAAAAHSMRQSAEEARELKSLPKSSLYRMLERVGEGKKNCLVRNYSVPLTQHKSTLILETLIPHKLTVLDTRKKLLLLLWLLVRLLLVPTDTCYY